MDPLRERRIRTGVNAYQEEALFTKTDSVDNLDLEIARFALGVSDEAGEVSGAVKKYLRGDFGDVGTGLARNKLRERVSSELGDVLWYISILCHILNIDLGDVTTENIRKLRDRHERNQIKGDGDDR